MPDVGDRLAAIPNALPEPLGMRLPASLRPPGTSEYFQCVEVAADFDGEVPEGFEVAELPAGNMMVFQGPPFEDKDSEQATSSLWDVMKSHRPETCGFTWADDGSRFQPKPEGHRGYQEGQRRARRLSKPETRSSKQRGWPGPSGTGVPQIEDPQRRQIQVQ